MKSEDEDEEKPQSSQLHHRQTEQMETEADEEDCGGPEPEPDPHLQSDTEDNSGDSSEHCDDDGKETNKIQSDIKLCKSPCK